MKRIMVPFIKSLPSIMVLTMVWCIWNDSLAPLTVVKGTLLSILALLITNGFLLRASYSRRYTISVFVLLRYIAVLFIEIFRSGIHAIHITITGRIRVGIVDLPTSIKDPLHGVLVATAITLTPGTVTIDYSPGSYKVVWIDCSTSDPFKAAELIKGSFERVLLGRKENGS